MDKRGSQSLGEGEIILFTQSVGKEEVFRSIRTDLKLFVLLGTILALIAVLPNWIPSWTLLLLLFLHICSVKR